MLHLIYGKAGSGKSTLLLNILKQTADRGGSCLLVVPEQQVLSSERAICELGISATVAEVTSFRRLCNSIFRTYGGLCYRYIGKGARKLLCWKALHQLAPLLSLSERDAEDLGRVDQFSSAITEMTLYNLTPAKLTETAPLLGESLRKKVEDLAAVAALYGHLLHHDYDDPAEDLTRAAELLADHDFFAGKTVFLDSFAGFTPQQADLLRYLFRQSEEVYLTLPCLPGGDDLLFQKPAAAEEIVLRIAENIHCEVIRERVLSDCLRAESDDLRYLAAHLFGEAETPPPSDSIALLECADLFEEAEAAAAKIAKLVREGARYREIAIIARSAERYDGILDSALERYGIPYYTSRRRDIATMPEIRLVLAALAVANYDWQTEDVIAYLRTYLTALSPDECDPIEEYAYLWKIRGSRFYDETPWNMNPRGFAEEFTDADQERLDLLNALRSRFVPPLAAFCEAFQDHPTVRSVSEALYRFLCGLQIPERLSAQAEENRRLGNRVLADTQTQVWNCLIDALDQMVTVAGEEIADPALYTKLLTLLLKESDIGTIPSGQDQVTVGSADLLRGNGIRHVFLLGVCEGVFPAQEGARGYFDDRERAELAENNLLLAEGGEALIHNELYYFYTAACFASRSLTVSYTAAEGASMAVRALCKLFPDLKSSHPSEWGAERMIYTRDSALHFGLTHREDALGRALLGVIAEDQLLSGQVNAAKAGISVGKCRISPTLMESISPRRMELTPSRLERYISCPFSYFLRYVLYLSEPRDSNFKSTDTGTFIHKLLEDLIPQIAASAETVSEDAITKMVDEAIDEYRLRMLRDWQDPRLKQMFERARPFAKLLLRRFRDEFRQSDFRPVCYELQIGGGGLSPLQIPLQDGGSVGVKGVVDRVDCYETDGKYYVRVVDYKTYDKTFSRADVQKGLDAQMLLYLFSLCENQDPTLSAQLGVPVGEHPLPAGILYLNVGTSGIPKDAADDPERAAEGYFKANGLLLWEEENLSLPQAMETDLGGRYIPVSLDKSGNLSRASKKSLADKEEFATLRKEVCEAIGRCGEGIRSGNADAEPLSDSAHDGCMYCKMRPVCRRRKE